MAATYNGYTVLSLKFNENATDTYIFLKKHNVRDQSDATPKDRTLFIQGLPPYATKEMLKPVFEKFGKIHKIFLQTKLNTKLESEENEESKFFRDKPSEGFKVGYIVYHGSAGVTRALSHPVAHSLRLTSVAHKSRLVLGLAKWRRDYNAALVDKEELRREVTEFMTRYDEEEKKRQEEVDRQASAGGEDGWETVTRKGRNPGIARKESVNKHMLSKERLKRSKKQLLNFYQFQIRESKMNHLESLRKKFEEDKQKIDVLKRSRRFKPF